jgi:excisionase family DNA binding protein
MKEYLKVEDVMQLLKISRTTAYGYLSSGRLKYFKVGRLVRIRPDDLRQFIEGKPSKKEEAIKGGTHGQIKE